MFWKYSWTHFFSTSEKLFFTCQPTLKLAFSEMVSLIQRNADLFLVFRFVSSNSVYMYFAMFTRADKLALRNRLAWILFLVHARLLHSSQNVVYVTLLYQKSWQTPVLERPVNDKCSDCDSVQNLWLAIKSMFSTTNCVCNLGSLKIHLFFLNERWYKLWLKIAITYFSNTRFTCKIISALYIWRHIKAGKICFVATATWNRSSPSFLSVVTSPSSTKTCSEKRTVFRERSSRKTVGC